MAERPLNTAVRFLHRLAALPLAGDRTDRQLLKSFAEHGDQPSFAELVRRHGPLVWGVCRRVLQDDHDAEDAFQATFLVLSRRANGVSWHESAKHWLYETAYRVALRGRANRDRRRARERQAASKARTEAPSEVSWREVQLALDEELHRLPVKYRTPLMLCYLEGQTQEEAARQLGWTSGELRGRLWRGRDLLRERLARRGLALSVLLAAMLAENAPAAVPSSLATATIQAGVQFAAGQAGGLVSTEVLALTHEALRAMSVAKLKLASAVVLGFVLLVSASGAIAHRAYSRSPEPVVQTNDDVIPTITGIVGGSGSIKSSLTLYGRDEPFVLARTVRVTQDDGTAIPLADIRGGTRVDLVVSDDKKTVTAIRATRPTLRGEVKDVNVSKKIIIVVAGREPGRASSLPVTADAKIVVNGKECKLADVKKGMQVHLLLSLGRRTVVGIRAEPAVPGKNKPLAEATPFRPRPLS